MPFIPFVLALLFVVALVLASPLLLVLRYRAGTARRRGSRWIATVNMVSMLVSTALFLWVVAVTALWVPNAVSYSLGGLIVGCLLVWLDWP